MRSSSPIPYAPATPILSTHGDSTWQERSETFIAKSPTTNKAQLYTPSDSRDLATFIDLKKDYERAQNSRDARVHKTALEKLTRFMQRLTGTLP